MRGNGVFWCSLLCIFALCVIYDSLNALPLGALSQPEFEKNNFLFTADIPEMNVDFAIAWTDSTASFFLYAFNAVFHKMGA